MLYLPLLPNAISRAISLSERSILSAVEAQRIVDVVKDRVSDESITLMAAYGYHSPSDFERLLKAQDAIMGIIMSDEYNGTEDDRKRAMQVFDGIAWNEVEYQESFHFAVDQLNASVLELRRAILDALKPAPVVKFVLRLFRIL